MHFSRIEDYLTGVESEKLERLWYKTGAVLTLVLTASSLEMTGYRCYSHDI